MSDILAVCANMCGVSAQQTRLIVEWISGKEKTTQINKTINQQELYIFNGSG